MSVLVIAEHDHGSLKGATLNTVSAALQCGGDVHVLIAGQAASGAARRALRRTSSAKRGVVDMEVMRNIANAHAGADARGLPS